MWELNHKENWALKNWCFWTVALAKTFESPLDCKGMKPVKLKEINPEYSLEGLMLKRQYFGSFENTLSLLLHWYSLNILLCFWYSFVSWYSLPWSSLTSYTKHSCSIIGWCMRDFIQRIISDKYLTLNLLCILCQIFSLRSNRKFSFSGIIPLDIQKHFCRE